jgi:hypothetical protein
MGGRGVSFDPETTQAGSKSRIAALECHLMTCYRYLEIRRASSDGWNLASGFIRCRFYEAGMLKSTPTKSLRNDTVWRFFNQAQARAEGLMRVVLLPVTAT